MTTTPSPTPLPPRRTGLAKSVHKIRHFRSGKLYRASRRQWMRLRGRPIAHFLHIRKAGGSAIKTALRPHAGVGPYFMAFHPHRITINHVPRGEKVFFFVRDPVARFVSGFASRQRQGAPAHHVPWTETEREVFAEFDSASALAEALASSDQATRQRAQWAMNAVGHVNSSYWDWFIDEQTFVKRSEDILFIGRQEHFDADFTAMLRALQLPEQINPPREPKNANRSPRAAAPPLSRQALAALQEHYAADYRFLELCRERHGLSGYDPAPPSLP